MFILNEFKDKPIVNSLNEIEEILMVDNFSEIFDYVGAGMSANVYRDDIFAIKVFNKRLGGGFRYRDCDEEILIELTNTLYFPKLYAYEKAEFVIMEYIDGVSIKDLAQEYLEDDLISLPVEAFNYFLNNYEREIKEIVSECLNKNIIPKDLHSDNILIRENGSLCVVDVGFFKKFSTFENTPNYLTQDEINKESNVTLTEFNSNGELKNILLKNKLEKKILERKCS